MVLRAADSAARSEKAWREGVNANDFRRIALGMAGAIESSHMGHPDFRANGKIFATIHHDDRWGMVKLTPDQQKKLVGENKTFTPESGAWGRAGSTKVHLESVDEETLGEAMTLAWQNTVKAKSTLRKRTKRKP
jgi:hypothetical protein